MTSLKPVNFGINQYCGPAVLSALTGKTTDECAAVISSINGRREIKAVNTDDLIKAFQKLRFDVQRSNHAGSTLYGTFLKLHRFDGFYFILVPKHVVAVEVKDLEIFLIDNHSKEPIDAAHSARLMQKVDAVYKVVKKAEPIFVRSEIELAHINKNVTQIWKKSIYEDEKDNTEVCLGSFRYEDNKELGQIANLLLTEAITS